MKITENTTLGELINILGDIEKADKTPTSKALRETAEPLADMQGCTLYANGYAVYDNCCGRTVMWIRSCVSFTYYFDKLREAEKDYMRETEALPEGFLESLPWFMALTIVGDHRIEVNLLNRRQGGRNGSKDYRTDDYGDHAEQEESYRRSYSWNDGYVGESPEAAYIREETRSEMLSGMTDKQREVFVLYYQNGYTQQEIADMLGVAQRSICERLEGALKKAKKLI